MNASLAIWVMEAFNGLSTFSVLLLMALGLAIIFGQMGVINMAHGEFLTIGAYTTYFVSHASEKWAPWLSKWYFLLAVVVAFAIAGLVGLVVEHLMVRRLYHPPLHTLLAAWGLSLILRPALPPAVGAPQDGAPLAAWVTGSLKPPPAIA